MPDIKIPTPLRPYAEGQSKLQVEPGTAAEVLEEITTRYPALKKHLYAEGGQLRPYVNLFLGDDNIKELHGLETPVQEGDQLMIIPSIAGG
jgi:adenylyltransferase/sulfurtransferase